MTYQKDNAFYNLSNVSKITTTDTAWTSSTGQCYPGFTLHYLGEGYKYDTISFNDKETRDKDLNDIIKIMNHVKV